jgi:hypothetical protein
VSLKHILIRNSLVNSWWIFLKANALELMTICDQFISEIETIDKNNNRYMIEIASHFLKVTF